MDSRLEIYELCDEYNRQVQDFFKEDDIDG